MQGQYLDAKYRSLTYQTVSPPPASSRCTRTAGVGGATVDCSGERALRSPKVVASASLQQTIALGEGKALVAEAIRRLETSKELDTAYIPETSVGSAERVDISLTYRDTPSEWSIGAFVNNLTDKAQPASAVVTPGYAVNGLVALAMQAPRTYGLRFNSKF